MHLPSSLLEHLRIIVPGFGEEEARVQRALAQMLWLTTHPRRRHLKHEGMTSMSVKTLDQIWGIGQRMRDHGLGGYFHVLSGSNLSRQRYTNAYRPTDRMAEALRRCLEESIDDQWVDASAVAARVVRKFPNAIKSLSSDGKRNTKWKGVEPANCTFVNRANLVNLRDYFHVEAERWRTVIASPNGNTRANVKALDRLELRWHVTSMLLRKSYNAVAPGFIPIQYSEVSTGRITTEGVSLQSAPREIRSAALAGCWDYDLSNCHWALAFHLAARHGYHCRVVQHYLENKDEVRSAIAKDVGITVKQAKECLLMLMYGATRSQRDWGDDAFPTLITLDNARRLYQNATFDAMRTDISKAREVILKNLPVRAGWIVNALGLQISNVKSPAARLSHILQGLEAKALMAVVRQYGRQVKLCVHDGWVSQERLVLPDVEKLVSDAIGVPVEVEEVQLPPVPVTPIADLAAPSVVKTLAPDKILLNQQVIVEFDDFPHSSSLWGGVRGVVGGVGGLDVERPPNVKGSIIVSNSPEWADKGRVGVKPNRRAKHTKPAD